MTKILRVFGPEYFFGYRPPNFWNFLLILSQIPIRGKVSGRSAEGPRRYGCLKTEKNGKTEVRPELIVPGGLTSVDSIVFSHVNFPSRRYNVNIS